MLLLSEQNFWGYRYGSFPFAEAELSVWGALPEGVSVEPTEDPVKNGACLRNVTHRRWVKVRVRRLGSVGVRSSLEVLSP